MEKLIHTTTKEHYEKYATITGGAGRADLKKACMEMIGGDIEALKEAYLEDRHLNNIDKVLKKAGTLITMKSVAEKRLRVSDIVGKTKPKASSHHVQMRELKAEYQKRCRDNGLLFSQMEPLFKARGGGGANWFLTFDMQGPLFVQATREGRKKWKEMDGGMHSAGVSASCITSGLKHVMIFDILGCEFVEEVR